MNQDIINMINKDTLSQPKILLIEDCKCDTVLIKHILSEYYPFTLVDSAETKNSALQYLEKNEYDLILLDLNLPDTTGLSDIQDIRNNAKAIPLIIITGSCNETTKEAATKYGANGIIGKAELIGISFFTAMEQAVNNVKHAA
ncbi:MAG: response regulator [Alphaproteobacteria bacterium]|nr:response regulator [Alphaproteobacteria bacterium]